MTPLNRRRLLQLSAGLGVAAATPAWTQDITADWSGDVAILRQVWETMHPGLYRYSTPQEISARLDGLAEAWRAPGASAWSRAGAPPSPSPRPRASMPPSS